VEKLVYGLLRSPGAFVVFEITKIVTFSLLWFEPIPLSVEEVELWICCHPSYVEVIEVEFWLCLSL